MSNKDMATAIEAFRALSAKQGIQTFGRGAFGFDPIQQIKPKHFKDAVSQFAVVPMTRGRDAKVFKRKEGRKTGPLL